LRQAVDRRAELALGAATAREDNSRHTTSAMQLIDAILRSGWLMAWWMFVPAGAVVGSWAVIAALRLTTRP
jgi:hypothetical protein